MTKPAKLNVLLVSDNEQQREILTDLVRKICGSEPHPAATGYEAISCLTSQPIQILIAAENLSGMSGNELLIKARLFNPTIKTVLLSSEAEQSETVHQHDFLQIGKTQLQSDLAPWLRSLTMGTLAYCMMKDIFPTVSKIAKDSANGDGVQRLVKT